MRTGFLIIYLLFFYAVPVLAQDNKIYNIYMISWNGFDSSAEGFKDYMLGKDVKFNLTLRNVKENTDNIENLKSEIRQINPDIIITWGTAITLGIFGQYNALEPDNYIRNIPGVFMAISDPIATNIISDFKVHPAYLTGVTMNPPIEAQLENAKLLINFQTLGFIYDSNNLIANEIINNLKIIAPALNIKVLEKSEDADETIARQIKNLTERNIDSVYLDQTSMLEQDRKRIIKEAIKKNIPAISNNIDDVKNGALVATVSSPYNIGLLAASKAYLILTGQKPVLEIPVSSPVSPVILVNPDVVKKLGLKIPADSISKIRFIR